MLKIQLGQSGSKTLIKFQALEPKCSGCPVDLIRHLAKLLIGRLDAGCMRTVVAHRIGILRSGAHRGRLSMSREGIARQTFSGPTRDVSVGCRTFRWVMECSGIQITKGLWE